MSLIRDILVSLGVVEPDQPDNDVSVPAFDLRAELDRMAREKGVSHVQYNNSIVDLLDLLGLPSDLEARTRLAAELNLNPVVPPGSPEFNIRLHQALLDELERRGGKVPREWKTLG